MDRGQSETGALYRAVAALPPCNICRASTVALFTAVVLSRYDVAYYQCVECGFIQTESPYWLSEAYTSAISSLDVGQVARNLAAAERVAPLIMRYFDCYGRFLDYAGGYGMFVRLMRDKGFDFVRQDAYCQNLFAERYDIEDVPIQESFELVTAFEVFEHLENPLEDIATILKYSDSVLFSTELQEFRTVTSAGDWWYFAPEAGQYVAFYTMRSLQLLAQKFDRTLYSDGRSLHMLTTHRWSEDPLALRRPSFVYRALRKLPRLMDRAARTESEKRQLSDLAAKDFEAAAVHARTRGAS